MPPIEEFGIELDFGTPAKASPAKSRPINSEPKEQVTPVAEQETDPAKSESSDEPVIENDSPDVVQEAGEIQEEIVEEPTKELERVPAEAIKQEEIKEQEEVQVQEEEVTVKPVEAEPIEKVEIDERALYNSEGGSTTSSEGANLDLTGWVWDFEPTPYDDSAESGKIVYRITIDDEGYILKIVAEVSTVSPTVEKYYRQAVERLTFSKTSGYRPAPTSTGKITFIIKTK